MNKIFTAFFIQAFTSTPANTKIQIIAWYSTVMDRKGQVSNKYEKMESNYLLNIAATRHSAFNFSLCSLRNMSCECEHNYAIENVYNTVREFHQNCQNFLRSLMRKSFVPWSVEIIQLSTCCYHCKYKYLWTVALGQIHLPGGLKYLTLLVIAFKQLFFY